MKYLVLPAAVLALLLGLSLENARILRADTADYLTAVEQATTAAEREDWESALKALRSAQKGWDARKPWLHIVTAHDELEAVDALFATTESFAIEQDRAEFRAEAAELSVQLRVVAELQQLSVRNVL